jgi:hypothetical protein
MSTTWVRCTLLLLLLAPIGSAQRSKIRLAPGYSGFTAPERPRVTAADVTIEVRSGPYSSSEGLSQVVILNDPADPDDDQIFQDDDPAAPWDQPLRFPLIVAFEKAEELGVSPCVIGIYGRTPGGGMQLGGGDAGLKAYRTDWGATPMVFTVLGLTADAEIFDFSLNKDLTDNTPTGGVADAWFEGLAITATGAAAVLVPVDDTFGKLRIYDCTLGPENLQGYQGLGWNWGIRSHGFGTYDFRDVVFAPVLEHAIYLDALQGDSYFIDVVHTESTRTAIQIVARAYECPFAEPERAQCLAEYEFGFVEPRPPSTGTLLIENLSVGRLWGAGGSAVSIAGHLGDIVIRDLSMVSTNPSHGAVVVYTDGIHGAHLRRNPRGQLYSNGAVYLEDFTIDLAAADRDLILLSGARQVHIPEATLLASPGWKGMGLDGSFQLYSFQDEVVVIDGVLQRFTGTVPLVHAPRFYLRPPLSQNPLWQVPVKILDRGLVLTDDQIDALNFFR